MIRTVSTLLLLFLLCLLSNVYSDDVRIVGWVLDERDRPLRDAVIYVYKDDRKIDDVEVNRRGRFTIDMDVNSYYIIEITAPDKAHKKLSFSTNIPPTLAGARGLGFEFIMELFSNYPGLELELFDRVLLNIYFDPTIQSFTFDEQKYEEVYTEIEEAKVYIEEFYRKKEEYDDLVESAGRLYQEDNLEAALDLYSQAASFDIPGETHASEQVKVISRRLGIPTQEEIREYEDLVAKADERFQEQKYEKALDLYREALSIIPDRSRPANRINESERLLAELAAAEKPEDPAEEEIVDEPVGEKIIDDKVAEVVTERETPDEIVEEKPKEVVKEEPEVSFREETTIPEEVAEEVTETVKKETAVTEDIAHYHDVEIRKPSDFVVDEWKLTDEQLVLINEVVAKLRDDNNANLIIHSHVNINSDRAYSFYLSKKKSTAVIHFLLNKDIDINRLHQVSYIDASKINASDNSTLQFEIKYNPEFQQIVKNSHKNSLRYLDNLSIEPDFSTEVEFLVQFLAAINPVKPEYYKPITDRLPDKNIYYYYGERRLHHYSVGNIRSLPMAMQVHRDLRSMGFNTYIIALYNGNRVLTTEISELLNENN